MRQFSMFQMLAHPSVAAGIGLVGCTTKEGVGPTAGACATTATVCLCHGRTAVCLTEHTTLELADGTRLRPAGAVWKVYLPHQTDGQVLRIGYQVDGAPHTGEPVPGSKAAIITCLESSRNGGGNG